MVSTNSPWMSWRMLAPVQSPTALYVTHHGKPQSPHGQQSGITLHVSSTPRHCRQGLVHSFQFFFSTFFSAFFPVFLSCFWFFRPYFWISGLISGFQALFSDFMPYFHFFSIFFQFFFWIFRPYSWFQALFPDFRPYFLFSGFVGLQASCLVFSVQDCIAQSDHESDLKQWVLVPSAGFEVMPFVWLVFVCWCWRVWPLTWWLRCFCVGQCLGPGIPGCLQNMFQVFFQLFFRLFFWLLFFLNFFFKFFLCLSFFLIFFSLFFFVVVLFFSFFCPFGRLIDFLGFRVLESTQTTMLKCAEPRYFLWRALEVIVFGRLTTTLSCNFWRICPHQYNKVWALKASSNSQA